MGEAIEGPSLGAGLWHPHRRKAGDCSTGCAWRHSRSRDRRQQGATNRWVLLIADQQQRKQRPSYGGG